MLLSLHNSCRPWHQPPWSPHKVQRPGAPGDHGHQPSPMATTPALWPPTQTHGHQPKLVAINPTLCPPTQPHGQQPSTVPTNPVPWPRTQPYGHQPNLMATSPDPWPPAQPCGHQPNPVATNPALLPPHQAKAQSQAGSGPLSSTIIPITKHGGFDNNWSQIK